MYSKDKTGNLKEAEVPGSRAQTGSVRPVTIMLILQPDTQPYDFLIFGLGFYHDKTTSESLSHSSSLMTSSQDSQEHLPWPVYQMMAQVTDELKNATYRVDLTVEGAILHADPNFIKVVLDCSESHHNFTHGTLNLPPAPRTRGASRPQPTLDSIAMALRMKMIRMSL